MRLLTFLVLAPLIAVALVSVLAVTVATCAVSSVVVRVAYRIKDEERE